MRYPVAEHVVTQEPDLDLNTAETESPVGDEAESTVESEDECGEMSDVSDENLEAEPLPCAHPAPESISKPVEEPEAKPVPTPRQRKEGNVRDDTPIPHPRRSQRTTAGRNRNPFNLPRSACNAVSFSPDLLSQVLAGMVLYSSQLRGAIDA